MAYLDLPFSGYTIAVGHHGQNDRICATTTHIDVDVLLAVLTTKNWQTLADGGSHHERVGGTCPGNGQKESLGLRFYSNQKHQWEHLHNPFSSGCARVNSSKSNLS